MTVLEFSVVYKENTASWVFFTDCTVIVIQVMISAASLSVSEQSKFRIKVSLLL